MALTEHDLKIISVRELMKEREKARKDTNFALSDGDKTDGRSTAQKV